MKRISFYIILVVAIGALSSSYWAYQKYFRGNDESYLYFTAEKGDVQEVVKVRGEVVAQQEYDLEFPFMGTVEKVFVGEGKTVKEGDELMKLDTTEFNLEIAEINGQLAQAGASIKSAQAQVAQYRADVDSAKEILKQYEAALEGQVKKLVDIELGAREPQLKVSETAVENAQRSLVDAEKELENAREKADSDSRALVETSKDVVASLYVSVDRLFTETLEDVIYPVRMVASRTCVSHVLDETYAVSMRDSCLSMLSSYESLKASIQPSDSDDLDEVLMKLNQQKVFISSLRNFLSQLLTALDSDAPSANRTFVTTSQTQVESLSAGIVAQIESINALKVANNSAIDLAQNKVNAAENALKTAEDQLALLKAGPTPEQVEAQKSEVERARAQIEAQKSQIKRAEALVQSQQAQVSNAQANVTVIRARLGKVQDKIKKATIYSPVDAQVVKINLEEQEVFRPGTPAISLSSDSYKVLADVSELDIGRVKEAGGNDVKIELDAFEGEEFSGKVLSVEPKEITKDGDRFYQVNASLIGKDGGVRSGMSADLYIIISSKQGVLKVPEIAVNREDEREYVYVLEGEEKKEVDVELGISDGDFVEVIKGVKEGDTLVVSAD